MQTDSSDRVAWSITQWATRYSLSRAAAYKLIAEGKGPKTAFIPGTTKQIITVESDAEFRAKLNGKAA